MELIACSTLLLILYAGWRRSTATQYSTVHTVASSLPPVPLDVERLATVFVPDGHKPSGQRRTSLWVLFPLLGLRDTDED